MPPDLSDAEPFPDAERGGDAWRVLLVTGSTRRQAQVRAAVASLPVVVGVDTSDTVVDALLRLMRRPVLLLVLDLAVDDAFAPVVVRHLARVAPMTTVMVFDDQARRIPDHPVVQAWDTLAPTLQQWWTDRP